MKTPHQILLDRDTWVSIAEACCVPLCLTNNETVSPPCPQLRSKLCLWRFNLAPVQRGQIFGISHTQGNEKVPGKKQPVRLKENQVLILLYFCFYLMESTLRFADRREVCWKLFIWSYFFQRQRYLLSMHLLLNLSLVVSQLWLELLLFV